MATYTVLELETEVLRYVTAPWGAAEHSGASLRALLGRVLREFAREVKCWYVREGTYASVTSVIDISATAITATPSGQYVFLPTRVRIPSQSSVLTQTDVGNMNQGYGAWEAGSSGTPGMWFMETPTRLRVYPTSSSAVTVTVDGYCYPAMVTGSSADSVQITFPDETDTAFINLMVAHLMTPNADGAAGAQRNRMMTEARAQMRVLRDRFNPIPMTQGFLSPLGSEVLRLT